MNVYPGNKRSARAALVLALVLTGATMTFGVADLLRGDLAAGLVSLGIAGLSIYWIAGYVAASRRH